MNKKNIITKLISLIIILFTILGIIFTQDLEQKNKETIFLTKDGLNSYFAFQDQFQEQEVLIIKKDFTSVTDEVIKQFHLELDQVQKDFSDLCLLVQEDSLPNSKNQSFAFKSKTHLAFMLICKLELEAVKKKLIQLQQVDYWSTNSGVHYLGASYTNLLLDRYSQKIKKVLFPALFVGIFILLFILTNKIITTLYLFIPCLSSASLSLVMTKIIWNETNLITSVVPLIVFVISLALSLHIYYAANELNSLTTALKHKRKPIFLMIATTYTGFLSLYLSELLVIQHFGLITANLIALSFLINLIWFKQASLAFNIQFEADKNKSLKLYQICLYPLAKKYIVAICILSISLAAFVYSKIPIITDATQYFPKSSGLKHSIDHVAQTVSGFPILDVIIKSDDEFSIQDKILFEKIEKKIEDKLSSNQEKIKIFGINQMVAMANYKYTQNKAIPEHQISYATLASQIPSELKQGYPIFESSYRFTLLGKPINYDQYVDILKGVDNELKDINLTYEYNGLYYHLMMAQKKMILTLLNSFLFSLLVISLFALFAFKSIKVFFIFLIVNIIPVCINFVLMKLFSFSFNIATIMTYSISLGLIVDSSFHIIHALSSDYSKSFYLKTIAKPVLQTNLILFFAFITFYINDFLPIQEFGVCLAFVILSGLFFDLFVLPTLFLGHNQLIKKLNP